MIYRIYQRDVQSGQKRDITFTDIIPTEAEAIVPSKEAPCWGHIVPDLLEGKVFG